MLVLVKCTILSKDLVNFAAEYSVSGRDMALPALWAHTPPRCVMTNSVMTELQEYYAFFFPLQLTWCVISPAS